MIIERFRTLAARGEDEVDWLVENLLTTGEWTYFVGEAGVGKSMLMIQLADALQVGKEFLGMKCKPRNCLYVQVDTGRKEWKHQVKQITGTESMAWTMYATVDNFLDNTEEIERIRQVVWGDYTEESPFYRALKSLPFGLVIFDVLNKMTSVDLNTKSGMSHVLDRLSKITKRGEGELRDSVHYILVHHPNATVKRGVNAGSGYKGFGGLCGNMLTLSSNLLVLEKSKVIAGRELLLERLPNGAWSVEKSDSGDFEYEDILGG